MTASWSVARWARVLNRMELRQVGIGLRFHGPPLWLEVTMSGPDSDQWPAVAGTDQDWDWQSSESCLEAARLAAADAGDDEVLAVVSRYTLENLVLNAVHEIGEWLRLDGARLWPPHLPGGDRLDGNGAVQVTLGFAGPPAVGPPAGPDGLLLDEVEAAVAASRFTYLPATAISYRAAGPVVTRYGVTGADVWRSTWSAETLDSLGGPGLATSLARDVHRAVVEHEADRVCRAFHIDGQRVWTLPAAGRAAGEGLRPVTLGLTYAPGAAVAR